MHRLTLISTRNTSSLTSRLQQSKNWTLPFQTLEYRVAYFTLHNPFNEESKPLVCRDDKRLTNHLQLNVNFSTLWPLCLSHASHERNFHIYSCENNFNNNEPNLYFCRFNKTSRASGGLKPAEFDLGQGPALTIEFFRKSESLLVSLYLKDFSNPKNMFDRDPLASEASYYG